jgi:hypothetical protein
MPENPIKEVQTICPYFGTGGRFITQKILVETIESIIASNKEITGV